jgi:hypothetical protein
MDTKRLREIELAGILEEVYLRNKRPDQAIKEIQELCEPMSEGELDLILRAYIKWNNKSNVYEIPIIDYGSLSEALLGKLSTPRLTEEEIATKLFDVDNPSPALLAQRFCGSNFSVQSDQTKKKYYAYAKALVGSEPRLTDWEKVLPMKWKEAKHLGKGKCGEYYVKGANRMRTDCLSALKSMSEPRLMEECPEKENK